MARWAVLWATPAFHRWTWLGGWNLNLPCRGDGARRPRATRGAAGVAVRRKSQLLSPRDGTVLMAGDEIALLVTKDVKHAVYRLIVGA
jgi:NhaP-type Na+/H+ and K+/H+ antiporter